MYIILSIVFFSSSSCVCAVVPHRFASSFSTLAFHHRLTRGSLRPQTVTYIRMDTVREVSAVNEKGTCDGRTVQDNDTLCMTIVIYRVTG